jgi:hypothetical protein
VPLATLPRLICVDDPGLRIVFRFLYGRVQDPGQEVEARRRPGTDDWTLRRLGIRGEPFLLTGFVLVVAGNQDYESERQVRRRAAALRGRIATLYRDGHQFAEQVAVLNIRYQDRRGLVRYADPYAGTEGAPLAADGYLQFSLELVIQGSEPYRTALGY